MHRSGIPKNTGKKMWQWFAKFSAFVGLSCATCLFASQQASSSSAPSTPSAPGAVRVGRSPGYPRPASRQSGKSNIDRRVELLTKMLDLNDVQKFDVRKILENGQIEANRLWNDQQIAPIDRMNKLHALREDAQKQFHAVLTEKQRKKYDEYLQSATHPTAAQAASPSSASSSTQGGGKTPQ